MQGLGPDNKDNIGNYFGPDIQFVAAANASLGFGATGAEMRGSLGSSGFRAEHCNTGVMLEKGH